MFGRAFGQFNPGSRGTAIAPHPVISYAGAGLFRATKVLTDVQWRSLLASPVLLIPPAGAGTIIQVISSSSSANLVSQFSGTNSPNLRYVGRTENVAPLVSLPSPTVQNLFTVISPANLINTGAVDWSNRGIEIVGSANPTGGQTSKGVRCSALFAIVPATYT